MKSILILHDIRSSQNVGSLFRTADALGVTKIYLSTITPQPLDRFGRPNTQLIKTALGAEQTVPWEVYKDISELLNTLRADGIQIIAIEQSSQSVDYKTVLPKKQTIACILGNEVEGLSEDILTQVDTIAEISMKGSKESLNVAVAGGIALARVLNH